MDEIKETEKALKEGHGDTENCQILPDIAELDEIDREIIRLRVETPSMSLRSMEKIIGKNRNILSDRIEDKNLNQYIKEAQETALQILLEGQTSAAQVLIDIVESEAEKTTDRINAAKEILKGVLSDKLNLSLDKNSFLQDDEVKKIIEKHGIKPE